MLLLFDIDGTLVHGATDAHRDALHAALRDVHGVDVSDLRLSVSPAGRTDGEIARVLLIQAGVDAMQIDLRARRVSDACCQHYSELLTADLSQYVLPGVPELLDWLSGRDEVIPALLTGNFECVARKKLAHAGIGHYFPSGQGAFGSDSEDRTSLPAIARRRAGQPGSPHPREQTVVIGDTPRDIACAHADDVRCIAVSTGPYPAEDLSQADAVLADAHGLRKQLSEMFGLT